MNLIDTADAYCRDEDEVGHNERLIAKALQGRYDDVIVATKAGHIRPGGAWEIDGRPEHIREACEASLKALGTDRIDLYQYHRPDPNVPYAETVGAFKELQDEGKVRWIGLSNCNVEQLEEALGVAEIVSVQNQLSLGYTVAARQGRGRRVHGARHRVPAVVAARRHRQRRAAPAEVDPVKAAAEEHGVSPQQVALAWLLSLGPTVIPIPGASRPESITDSAQAAELELTHGRARRDHRGRHDARWRPRRGERPAARRGAAGAAAARRGGAPRRARVRARGVPALLGRAVAERRGAGAPRRRPRAARRARARARVRARAAEPRRRARRRARARHRLVAAGDRAAARERGAQRRRARDRDRRLAAAGAAARARAVGPRARRRPALRAPQRRAAARAAAAAARRAGRAVARRPRPRARRGLPRRASSGSPRRPTGR